MKELKCRAWDTEKKVMIDDAIHHWVENLDVPYETLATIADDSRYEKLPYAGICDEDNRGIFLGDLLMVAERRQGYPADESPWTRYMGKVVYRDAMFLVEGKDGCVRRLGDLVADMELDSARIRIIGNVYENGDMLDMDDSFTGYRDSDGKYIMDGDTLANSLGETLSVTWDDTQGDWMASREDLGFSNLLDNYCTLGYSIFHKVEDIYGNRC